MKVTISIETDSPEKFALLIRLAREMGITITPRNHLDEVSNVSELSLAEAWTSEEDNRWDELYGNNEQ